MINITARIVDRLINLRKQNNVTREELSKEIGYPYYVIRRIEQEKSGNMDALIKIIFFWKEKINLNIESLFFEDIFSEEYDVNDIVIDDPDVY